MGFSVAVSLLLIALLIRYTQKTWASPGALYCVEWGTISFLSALHLFGMYKVSNYSWFIILVGSISYLVGVWLGKMIHIPGQIVHNMTIGSEKVVNRSFISKKAYWLLFAALCLNVLYDFIQSVSLLCEGYSLGEVRGAYYGTEIFRGYNRRVGLFAETIDLTVSVVELILVAVAIDNFFTDSRRNFKPLAAMLILELIKTFSNGGRFNLAYIIIELFACALLYKKFGHSLRNKVSNKLMRRVKVIIGILVSAIVLITFLRGSAVSELAKKYYRYICGNTVFFDLHVQSFKNTRFYSWFYAGFWGFFSYILPVFHNLLGLDYPSLYLETNARVMDGQTFLQIGKDMSTNAFITPFYHLYADSRFFGVIVGMILFGAIAGYFYKRATHVRDQYSVVCYLVITQMIFKSLQLYPFANRAYFFIIILFWILGKKWRIKAKNSF